MIIRIVLLSGLALIAVYTLRRRESLPVHAFLILCPLVLAAVAVIVPDATTRIARSVGVGRGVDLINYLVELGLLFVVLHYYAKFTVLESQITALVRALALREAGAGVPDRGPGRAAPPDPLRAGG